MYNVLITSEYFGKFSGEAKQLLLANGFSVTDNPYGHKFLTPEEIIPYAKHADALICDLEKITKEVIDSAPNLKIISRRGVGTDSVDVAYAEKKNIAVARTLGVVEPPVAELVMAYILEFSRRISVLNQSMHAGRWERCQCHSVNGKTLGIVGMGKIAYEVARRAHSFGMHILYTDTVRNERAEAEFGAQQKPVGELLEESDFVTLHLPLTENTANYMDYGKLCKMKQSAYLINAARGGVVNCADLKRALCENKLSGAAIDVFEKEPETNSSFRGMENVILTPHVGTFTEEIFVKMDVAAAENIISFFQK